MTIALLYVPAVQQAITTFATQALENVLQTEVHIGRVGIGFFNRIILDDVFIKDQNGKPLLKAARMSAKIELAALLHGQTSISNIQIYGFDIRLYNKGKNTPPNFQFLIDAFSGNKKQPANPHLKINSILIRRGKMSWDQDDAPKTPGRFNPRHIRLEKLSATLSLKQYTKDSLNLNVKKISFEEHSGLTLKQLSFKITANPHKAILEDFVLEGSHSLLTLQPVTFTYRQETDTLTGKKTFKDLNFQGSIDKSILAAPDFIPIWPTLKNIQLPTNLQAVYLEAQFQGNTKHLAIDKLQLHTREQDILLDAPLFISQLQNKEQRAVKVNLRNLQISRSGMKDLSKWLSSAGKKDADYLSATGFLQGNGAITYNNKQSEGQLNLHTDIGNLSLSGTWKAQRTFNARLQTDGLQIGHLTGNGQLGKAIFNLSVNGRLPKGKQPQISASGIVKSLTFKQYEYQNVALDVIYQNGGFNGDVSIDDPNIALTAKGECNLKSSTPYIKGSTSVRHFNPHALLLTNKYAGTVFQADVETDFQGNDIEDMDGFVRLNHFNQSTSDGQQYAIGPVSFQASNHPDYRILSLKSDFLNAELEGKFKLGTLIAHFRQLLHRYTPSFVKAPLQKKETPDEVLLSMEINNTEPVEKIFGIPLRIDQPGYLGGYLNSQTHEFNFNANIPSLDYNGQQLTGIRILAGHFNDSIVCNTTFKKTIGKAPVDFRLQARAANDNIHVGLDWANHAEKLYRGSLSTDTRFSLNEDKKMLTDISIHPSQIIVNDSVWNVHAASIHAAPKFVSVRHFKIDQADRFLMLNGNVSDNDTDSLTVELKDINLEYIFNIINFHTVDFNGQATGHAYATRLMKSPSVSADLQVRNFKFNDAYIGNMEVKGGWDKEKNAVSLDAHITDHSNNSWTNVKGDIRIGAPPRGGIDLMINTENIDLAFLNRYTEGIFTDLQGRASGWTRVFGPFKGINIEGDMLVAHASTKVDATNVEYHLVNDSVILRPDNIYFRNAIVYDRYGDPGKDEHYAVVNGVLQHTHMSNMRYNFNIQANNILGYDVKDFGDEVFCGTAFATGNISFYGQPGDLNININARPEANTLFAYNLTSPNTLTTDQFITYKSTADSISPQKDRQEHKDAPEPETDMHINFRLDLTPEATMKILMDPKAGDYIALNGHGNIRATYYNKGDFTMYGTYTVDHGIYKLSLQDVIRKDFLFNPGGTIIFSGSPTNADLNLQAVYTVPSVSLNDLSAGSTFSQNNVRVNCLMNLTGKAQSPQIGFDFDLPTVNEDEKQMVRSLISTEEEKNMQVIYLLGIGRFYTYDYNNTEQSQSSVAMKSLLSSTLSGQLNQMFSSLLGNNSNWNIGTSLSTGEVGWSDMDVEGLLSGRLLNNRLLINGNFGYRDNSTTTNNSNFIGDFDLQWLLTPNGNISLKAYSKTNDRYFTKSSLTTQGIGIALKRDFNSWKDIFRIFTPKRRKPQSVTDNQTTR